jgi:hypothetical protein
MVFQREKIISGNTSAMVEEIEPISYHCDGPTAMVLPREKERFCSYHCDGPTAMLLPRMRKHAQGC